MLGIWNFSGDAVTGVSRIILFILTIVVVVLAVGYAVRSHRAPTLQIAALLPHDTVAVVHVPDFEKTRNEWHDSEIYRLYTEHSVQDFLRKPLSRLPATHYTETRKRLEDLDPKDVFVALTSIANDHPTIALGFRYRGSQDNAEKVIGEWRTNLLGKAPGATTETVTYQKAQIQVAHVGSNDICSAYSGAWFFAGNNLDLLKSLIDRAGTIVKTSADSLATDERFRQAMAHLPSSYGFSFYFQPQAFAEKLSALRQKNPGANAGQLELLSKIQSVCGATRFDGSKLHDFYFVGMPELVKHGDLNRGSLALTTADTFFYAASLVDMSRQFSLVDASPSNAYLGAKLQSIGRGLAAAGITAKEWESAFGNEVGIVSDWSGASHWPTPLFAFAVKDFAKAKPMAAALAHILDDDAQWSESEKDGVHYLSSVYRMGFVALQPTVAISQQFMVLGLDLAAVQGALARANTGGATLSATGAFKDAARSLPAPGQSFTYLDLGLLYARLDAALRPMLLMGAAFMPAMNDYVDIGKLPEAEIIKRHLTPIVSSQRYDQNGYAAESIGPITVSQAGLALIGAGVAGAVGYQLQSKGGLTSPGMSFPPGKSVPPLTSPTPAGTP